MGEFANLSYASRFLVAVSAMCPANAQGAKYLALLGDSRQNVFLGPSFEDGSIVRKAEEFAAWLRGMGPEPGWFKQWREMYIPQES